MRRRLWARWIRIAEVIGTINMAIILTVIFVVIVGFMALPFKILADPLKVKKNQGSNWNKRIINKDILNSMKNQY